MVVDRNQQFGFATSLVCNHPYYHQLHQLALRSQIHSAHDRFSSFSRGRYFGPAELLDFFGRSYLGSALVQYRAGCRRAGLGGKANRPYRGTLMTWLSLFFIVASLLSFVGAQLVLKRAMESTNTQSGGLRSLRFISRMAAGIALMTISFFLTLGLLQRFDLSYLYPFQGLSVIIITILAAVILKEKLTMQLTIGGVLISAGIVLVSLS